MHELIDQNLLIRGFSFCNLNCSIYRIFCYRSIRSLKTLFSTNLKSLRKFRQFIQTKTNKKRREANRVHGRYSWPVDQFFIFAKLCFEFS